MTTQTEVVTDQQKQQYDAEGYTVVRELIPADVVAEIRTLVDEIVEGEHDATWPQEMLQIAEPGKYRNKHGGNLPWGIQNPSKHHPTFAAFCQHPRLVAAMQRLIGTDDIERHTDQALVKHAFMAEGDGGRSFYHQDSYYWKLEPGVGCNAWIALHDVGENAIALGIMPGTHADWTLVEHEKYFDNPPIHSGRHGAAFERFRIPDEAIDYSREVVLPMQPGDAAFFTNYTWHRAEPNLSGQRKAAYAIAYRKAGAKPVR